VNHRGTFFVMALVTCNRCGVPQDLSEFYLRGARGGPRAGELFKRCKTCSSKHVREFYAANKEQIKKRSMEHSHQKRMRSRALVELAKENKPCEDCGKVYPAAAMEFHHRDPATKLATISVLSASRVSTDPKYLLEEIKKCGLLCATCHRIRTRGAKPRSEVQALLDDPTERAALIALLKDHGLAA